MFCIVSQTRYWTSVSVEKDCRHIICDNFTLTGWQGMDLAPPLAESIFDRGREVKNSAGVMII
jgi:hypothetical protein